MNPSSLRLFADLPRRLRVWGLPLAMSIGTLGCVTPEKQLARGVSADAVKPAPQAHAGPQKQFDTRGMVRPVAQGETKPGPEKLPAPEQAKPAVHTESKRFVPITLDAVFHLAEGQNAQVNQAREKLQETYTDKNLADLSWIPDVSVVAGYNRHEGAIQNFRGRFLNSSYGSVLAPGLDIVAKFDLRELTYEKIKAEQKVWQQEGEVSRLTSETLVEAASTYFDLLAARESEAVGKRMEKLEQDVLDYAEKLVKTDKTAEWLVESARASVKSRQNSIAQARLQGDAAAARLAYLLGMSPEVVLVPAEATLLPVKMVDATQPTESLVGQALASGPGVQELEQMLSVIQRGIDSAQSCGRFLPTVEMHMLEGNFGAGPGSNLQFGNRWDMCVGLRWDLSGLCTAKDKLNKALSQQAQAEWGYRDLKGRLTMGVQESQQTIVSSSTQLTLSADQLKHAKESHKASNNRMRAPRPDMAAPQPATPLEVLNSIRGIEAAEYNALGAVRAHNKAQVRLLILMGLGGHKKHDDHHHEEHAPHHKK